MIFVGLDQSQFSAGNPFQVAPVAVQQGDFLA